MRKTTIIFLLHLIVSEATAATGSTADSSVELTFSEDVPAVCGINYKDTIDRTGSIKFKGERSTEDFATFKLTSNAAKQAKIWFTDISITGTDSADTAVTDTRLVKIAVGTDLSNLSSTTDFEQEFQRIDNQSDANAANFNTTDTVQALALVNQQAVEFKSSTTVSVKATVNVKCQ